MAHALLVAMGLGLGGLAVFAVQYQRPPDPGFADPAFRDARAAGSELSEQAVSFRIARTGTSARRGRSFI